MGNILTKPPEGYVIDEGKREKKLPLSEEPQLPEGYVVDEGEQTEGLQLPEGYIVDDPEGATWPRTPLTPPEREEYDRYGTYDITIPHNRNILDDIIEEREQARITREKDEATSALKEEELQTQVEDLKTQYPEQYKTISGMVKAGESLELIRTVAEAESTKQPTGVPERSGVSRSIEPGMLGTSEQFIQSVKRAPAIPGAMVGIGIQLVGHLIENFNDPEAASMLIQGGEFVKIPYVDNIIKPLGKEIKNLGQETQESWQWYQEQFPRSKDIQARVWDKPELLLSGKWWIANMTEMTPAFGAALLVGIASGGVAGIATGVAAGGLVGGLMEGTGTYDEAIRRGDTEEEALDKAAKMTLSAGVLNAISLGKMLSPAAIGQLRSFLLKGVWEMGTEWAEEPAEGVIFGESWPEFKERLKSSVDVLGPAFVMGTGGAAMVKGVDINKESELLASAQKKQQAGTPLTIEESGSLARTTATEKIIEEPEVPPVEEEIVKPKPEAKAPKELSPGYLKYPKTSPDLSEELGTFQEHNLEQPPKQLKQRTVGMSLEHAGDIFRELVNVKHSDPGYIGEKTHRIRLNLGFPSDILEEYTESDKKLIKEFNSKYNELDLSKRTPLLNKVRNLALAITTQEALKIKAELNEMEKLIDIAYQETEPPLEAPKPSEKAIAEPEPPPTIPKEEEAVREAEIEPEKKVAKEPWEMTLDEARKKGEIKEVRQAKTKSEYKEKRSLATGQVFYDVNDISKEDLDFYSTGEVLKDKKTNKFYRVVHREVTELLKTERQYHKDIIQKALSEGKPVLAEVLADYPNLAKQEFEKLKDKYESYNITPGRADPEMQRLIDLEYIVKGKVTPKKAVKPTEVIGTRKLRGKQYEIHKDENGTLTLHSTRKIKGKPAELLPYSAKLHTTYLKRQAGGVKAFGKKLVGNTIIPKKALDVMPAVQSILGTNIREKSGKLYIDPLEGYLVGDNPITAKPVLDTKQLDKPSYDDARIREYYTDLTGKEIDGFNELYELAELELIDFREGRITKDKKGEWDYQLEEDIEASPEEALRAIEDDLKDPKDTYEEIDTPDREDSRMAVEMGKILDLNVRFFKRKTGESKFNGVTRYGYTFIDTDSNNHHIAVLGHEIVHSMSKDAPDLYKKLVNAMEQEAFEKYQTAIDKDMDAITFFKNIDKYTPEHLMQELVGDTVGERMSDPTFWEKLYERSPEVVKDILKRIKKILRNLRLNETYRTSHYFRDLQKVHDTIDEVMTEYVKRKKPRTKAEVEAEFQRRKGIPEAQPTRSLVERKDSRTGELIAKGEKVWRILETGEMVKEATWKKIIARPEQAELMDLPKAKTPKESEIIKHRKWDATAYGTKYWFAELSNGRTEKWRYADHHPNGTPIEETYGLIEFENDLYYDPEDGGRIYSKRLKNQKTVLSAIEKHPEVVQVWMRDIVGEEEAPLPKPTEEISKQLNFAKELDPQKSLFQRKKRLQQELPIDVRTDRTADVEQLIDRYLADRDEMVQEAKSEADVLQQRIKEFNKARKYGRREQNIDMAIQVNIDLRGIEEEQIKKYRDKLTDEQKEILELSQNLTSEQLKIADDIIDSNNKTGMKAFRANIINNIIDNYTMRLWKSTPEARLETSMKRKFGIKTSRAKHRTLESILHGWALGKELRIKAATNALSTMKQEIAKVHADRMLMDLAENGGLISEQQLEGWIEVEHPNFTTWKWAGKAEEGKAYGKNFFMTEDGNIFEKRRMFAEPEFAKRLNNILGKSKLFGVPSIKGLTRFNAELKQTILVSSFFHHAAFLRSYLIGARIGFKNINPIKAWRAGNEAIRNFESEVRELVRGGLTIGRQADWDEIAFDADQTRIGKMVDRVPGASQFKNQFLKLRGWQTDFLFNVMGPGLKTQAALLEYRHLLRKHDKLIRSEIMTRNDVAKKVAQFVNDDFGGLHLARIKRNPTLQHIFRLGFLAPDWTESNVRTMTKAFKSGIEGEIYRGFWIRVATKGLIAQVICNAILAAFDDKTFWERYKIAWNEGYFRWLGVDITPLYRALGGGSEKRKYFNLIGHLRDPLKFIIHPIRSIKHKSSVIGRFAMDLMTGQDWAGRKFTTWKELFGIDDKGVYKTSRKGKYKKGEPKGGKLTGRFVQRYRGAARPLSIRQIPSYLLYEARSSTPIQVQSAISFLAGELDLFDSLSRSIGLPVTSAYKKPEEKKTGVQRRLLAK